MQTPPPSTSSPKPPPSRPRKPLPDGFLGRIESEVADGLPNEQARRLQAIRNLDYYKLRGAKLIERRPAEDADDFNSRIKRHLPFTRRVIRTLARLYDEPPTRRLDDDEATEWLARVYEQADADVLLQELDRYAHLNGVAAIQVGATGDPERPIALQLWAGWHEVVPFQDPANANEVAAVVTIDCYDNQTTYTIWTEDVRMTYRTEKLTPGQTAGGRIARFVADESGANPYGCLPFAFGWFEKPTAGFEELGVLGAFLSELNNGIDVELSDMAQAVSAYHRPIPIAYDCSEDFNPVLKIGGFVRVNRDDDGETESVPTPRLEYLQADLNITAGWDNIREVIHSELEALGVPLTAWTLDNRSAASGEAILAEGKPLTDYAKSRRKLAKATECGLAKACLTVASTYYPTLAGFAEAARTLAGFALYWPSPRLDLPSADRDREDKTSLELRLESRVMVVMRRFELNRDQALEHLKQVAADEAELAEILPPPEPDPDQVDDDQADDDVDPWKVEEDDDDEPGDAP